MDGDALANGLIGNVLPGSDGAHVEHFVGLQFGPFESHGLLGLCATFYLLTAYWTGDAGEVGERIGGGPAVGVRRLE